MTDYVSFLDDLMENIEYMENILNVDNEPDNFALKESENDTDIRNFEQTKNISSVFETFYNEANKAYSEINSFKNNFEYNGDSISKSINSVINMDKSNENTNFSKNTSVFDSSRNIEKILNSSESFFDSDTDNHTVNNKYSGDSFYRENKSDETKNYSESNDYRKNRNINIVLNNYSSIYNKSDEDNLINSLAEKIAEYVAYGGEGTHI